ncbi:acetoin reductase family protein [Cylindrobasidium torrendii FP15055 ss-10]|uniref:Acetoin reductase family protein n=1 Tax=Cylindrobasidium torrendii FP15055 ss-10 TaxID=1314674 RepID=A0A0D7AXL2_9AGAR|nr:acetoin reductase family protein [Cylindrobasidium torrendii FP15055 ss-10]
MAPSDYKNFKAKNAIVTGAADGIGRGIALRLASDGINLVINDLPSKQAQLDTLVKEIQAKGVKAVTHAGDVTDKAVNEALVSTCVKSFGSLDVMVCNAGTAFIKSIAETPYEEVEDLINTNFKSMWHGYNSAAQQMIKQDKGGRIIGAASSVAKKGYPMMAAYSSSKFCVRGLTQSAAQEWGQFGITVNSYCPGVIWTPLIETLGNALQGVLGQSGESPKEMWAKSCALKRVGEPDDIAGVVSWFASKDSGYVTGQNLNVDGGGLFD